VKANAPALPAEAPAAGPSRSSTVTDRPLATAAIAAERPTTPAPITMTSGAAIYRTLARNFCVSGFCGEAKI
jgi:hypothetical protein